MELQEPVSDAKGEAQAATTVRREYRCGDWGGPTRNSDEGAVMALEQRVGSGCGISETTGNRMNSMDATDKPFRSISGWCTSL